MNFIDTHFHLDLCENIPSLLKEIEFNKIYTITVTNTPSVFDHSFNITKGTKFIRTALGLHPELALKRESELKLFKENIKLTRYIGEIGLDHVKNTDDENKRIQKKVFEAIIDECSKAGNKILTIHSRGAQKEINDIIGPSFPGKIILHWFTGSISELDRSLQNGFYFSINNAMLKSQRGKNIIKNIPPNRILTESDGPFITLGKDISSPLTIEKTVEQLSDLLGLTKLEMSNKVFDNFKLLLSE